MGFKEIIDDFLNRSPDRGEAVDAPVADAFEEQEQEIFGKIEDQRKYREGFYRFIRHPLRVMMEDPVTVLFISVLRRCSSSSGGL